MQAGEPGLSVPTAGPAQSQELLDESLRGSVDLGYSLVTGSNTFVGLQEVNTRYLRVLEFN